MVIGVLIMNKIRLFILIRQEFDPFVSFLDYYAFLIIGIDMDSYAPLGGTEYFTQASDIAMFGSNSGHIKRLGA